MHLYIHTIYHTEIVVSRIEILPICEYLSLFNTEGLEPEQYLKLAEMVIYYVNKLCTCAHIKTALRTKVWWIMQCNL